MENYVKYRRDLHKIPETFYQEFKTSEYIHNILKDMPCKLTSVAKTGWLAFFDNGKEETIAFRADIDALAIQEAKDSEYKSTHDGVMHACGHDAHTAILLNTCEILNQLKEVAEGNFSNETFSSSIKSICDEFPELKEETIRKMCDGTFDLLNGEI